MLTFCWVGIKLVLSCHVMSFCWMMLATCEDLYLLVLCWLWAFVGLKKKHHSCVTRGRHKNTESSVVVKSFPEMWEVVDVIDKDNCPCCTKCFNSLRKLIYIFRWDSISGPSPDSSTPSANNLCCPIFAILLAPWEAYKISDFFQKKISCLFEAPLKGAQHK